MIASAGRPALIPDPSASAPLALTGGNRSRNLPAVTFNFSQHIVNAVESQVFQNVQGTVNFSAEAKKLFDIISRYGQQQTAELEASVYELEDRNAPADRRVKAKKRLKEFLARLGDTVQDAATGVLEKYIESRLGI